MVQFGETIPQSFLPLFIEGLGISAAVVSLIYNIRNIEQSALRMVSGSHSDNFGRRRLILLRLVLIGLVPFIYWATWDPWFLSSQCSLVASE